MSSSGSAKDTVAVDGAGDLRNGDLQCTEVADVAGDGSGIDNVAFRFGAGDNASAGWEADAGDPLLNEPKIEELYSFLKKPSQNFTMFRTVALSQNVTLTQNLTSVKTKIPISRTPGKS